MASLPTRAGPTKLRGTGIKLTFGELIFDSSNYLLLLFFAFLTLYPFWYIFVMSMNEGKDSLQGPVWFWPRKWTLTNYSYVLLNPQILMVCILELIFNFKIFDQVYATTQGGPASASQTVIMLLYDTAFKFFRFGDASVMAVFVFITLLVVTLLQWRIFRKPVEY